MPSEIDKLAVNWLAVAWARQRTDQLMANRKGHGGGPCTYRQLRPKQLQALLIEAYLAGALRRGRN